MAEASASGGRAAGGGGGGGGMGDGFTNLAAEDSEDELRSSEWEARLASGDLPEDFLRVTEPKAEHRDDFAFPWNKAAWPVYESDFESFHKLTYPVFHLLNRSHVSCLLISHGSNQNTNAECGRQSQHTTHDRSSRHHSQFSRVPESPSSSGDSCRVSILSIHSSAFQFESSIEY